MFDESFNEDEKERWDEQQLDDKEWVSLFKEIYATIKKISGSKTLLPLISGQQNPS